MFVSAGDAEAGDAGDAAAGGDVGHDADNVLVFGWRECGCLPSAPAHDEAGSAARDLTLSQSYQCGIVNLAL